MPEIAEVARCVHFLRLHLVGKTIAKVTAPDDASIFGKVGTSGPEFEKAVKGRKVTSAGSQGKYFWLTFDQPPHAVMHLGMTGWVHIRGDKTAYANYYKKLKSPAEADLWPPKYTKFQLWTTDAPPVEVAFADPRRFSRVRLVHCPAASIRSHPPLSENGPDPVVDAATTFTLPYFSSRMRAKHVPVKALLLDQSVLSGVGNWVADEVLYHARAHPEQYCDEFSDEEVGKIYDAVKYVCGTSCELLGDSDEFPSHWLFNHRWGKGGNGGNGAKGAAALPDGEKLAFLTVGGRTSCYAPGLQKKTGHVVPNVKEEVVGDGEGEEVGAKRGKAAGKGKGKEKAKESAAAIRGKDAKGAGGRKRAETAESDAEEEVEKPTTKKRRRAAAREDDVGEEDKPTVKSSRAKAKKEDAGPGPELGDDSGGRRRSSRLKK